ncbi:MFS transporter [Oceanispirochaeta sp.]|jgi:MFS family permease|uniref:MFS transporter n=1 Tax=Oceanispirochaeta sp. TaxID=2035350 RepID=UPI0026036C46|nr:MFS transporter [Oceanispirochaeta sp.]MDA3958762.1 MFS transporter [Oceanispirochaeta sp.]
MIFRFSLYGFLKNQKYYEPFILLAFLQMGLTYTLIGLLIAFRELMVNLMEIPSGAIADVWGRRRSMIVSFFAYILHFSLVGTAGTFALNGLISFPLLIVLLFVSMLFFAVGDAFRTGTHKAMIFTWLRLQGRSDAKTEVYGYTRSWSQIGSAVSVLIACCFVYFSRSYVQIFYFSIIPYVINIINFMGYPKELDGEGNEDANLGRILAHIKESFTGIFQKKSLRRLILESMGYEGFFKSIKDYLQPILQQAALPVIAVFFAGISMNQEQQSVILIGPVYFLLYALSASASKQSHKLVKKTGSEDSSAKILWLGMLVLMAVLIPGMYFNIYWIMISGFVAYYVLQNLWTPVLISRFDAHSSEAQGATVMSIQSQSKSIATMVIAPLAGLAVDFMKVHHIGLSEFWPVPVIGFIISGLFLISSNNRK